jgi:riboflavin kinase/FMN adenylyltransferase
MAYIGHRPTINGMSRNIEVNIFDFNEDIYGKTIRINFLDYLRGDEKFNSLEDLKKQLEKDEKAARKILFKPK